MTLANDPQLTDMIGVMERLTAVLAAETEQLRDRRIEESRPLMEEKSQLARLYQEHHARLTRDRRPIDSLASAERDYVRTVAQRLDRTARDNARVIEASKSAVERVVEMMVIAVRSQNQAPSAYGRTGAMRYGAQGVPGRAMSVSLNDQF